MCHRPNFLGASTGCFSRIRAGAGRGVVDHIFPTHHHPFRFCVMFARHSARNLLDEMLLREARVVVGSAVCFLNFYVHALVCGGVVERVDWREIGYCLRTRHSEES